MKKIRIGVIGPSEIAFRRTVPAFCKSERIEYVGVAHASLEEWPTQPPTDAAKCDKFVENYGGKIYDGFETLIADPDIDAVYIPLPPGAHKKWALTALKYGKHVFVEKPSTTSLKDSQEIIDQAKAMDLAVHEDYAFAFHRQITALDEIIESGKIGELRLIRTTFCFPYRGADDFRYHKDKGGGAIIDCGGYPTKLAIHFLGNGARLMTASLLEARGHDVDVFGSATLQNENGITAQISWGMDNDYRCYIELMGSKGTASTYRVFSPPAEMEVRINISGENQGELILEPDDQFLHSAEYFCDCIENNDVREASYESILAQAGMIDEIIAQGSK